jgi:hypothetical protein
LATSTTDKFVPFLPVPTTFNQTSGKSAKESSIRQLYSHKILFAVFLRSHIIVKLAMANAQTTKSLRFRALRGELEVVEKAIPTLQANQLLVKVKAASINPVDIQLWGSGLVAVVSGDKGMGRDYSGSVVAVGDAVKGWSIGDDIFGLLVEIVSRQSERMDPLADQ